MNEKKIAFIICVNDDKYANECIYYIQTLFIPKGYEIDILTVSEAKGMNAAYNAAMNSSDAKYKIYLHQDVFLLDQNILYEILQIFQNPNIGMIGIVGACKLPYHAQMARSWDCGNVLVCNGNCLVHARQLDIGADDVITVEAIDGMLMITQYDIAWDEEVFQGFHFYDISQCIRFREHGWNIVLPKCKNVWALHDSGISSEKKYDETRKKFCEKYASYGFQYDKKDDNFYTKEMDCIETEKHFFQKAVEERDLNAVKDAIQRMKIKGYADTEIFYFQIYLDIVEKIKPFEVDWFKFREYFDRIKFALWRILFRDDADKNIMEEIFLGKLPLEVLQIVIQHCVINQEEMWTKLSEKAKNY